MFDQHHQHHSHAAPYPQKVEQHLAPTAEHLRLLQEMQETALASILERFPLKDNVIGEIVRMRDFRTHLLFTLNGRRHRIELPFQPGPVNAETLLQAQSAIGQRIAEELVQAFPTILGDVLDIK